MHARRMISGRVPNSVSNAIDGGDLLKSINGISTIRRGGHGLDPVIRGQSDQRLNSSIE